MFTLNQNIANIANAPEYLDCARIYENTKNLNIRNVSEYSDEFMKEFLNKYEQPIAADDLELLFII